MSKLILYDLPSKERNNPWSLNPWKTRLALNFKGIDYTTEWVEYPDIEPKFKEFGIPPNDPNKAGYFKPYSIPAVRFPDGTYVMDSWSIAQELEKRYPEPSLRIDSPYVEKVRALLNKFFEALAPHILPKIPTNLLTPYSAGYFERTRKESFGMSLEQLAKEKATKACWEKVKEPVKEMAGLLKEVEGPFFEGSTVSYADFIFVSFVHFLKRTDESLFKRFVDHDKVLLEAYEAAKQWFQKQD